MAYILTKTTLVEGEVSLGDKCVKLDGPLKADIVPTISKSAYSSKDPVYVYARGKRSDRPNYPRTHYDNDIFKQSATGGSYKPTVRLFKRWVRQYGTLVAPSFYVECAVHSVPNDKFHDYLPLSFASVGLELIGYTRNTVIKSVAGDKDILVSTQWRPQDFEDFQNHLLRDVKTVLEAVQSATESEANRRWQLAFGDF